MRRIFFVLTIIVLAGCAHLCEINPDLPWCDPMPDPDPDPDTYITELPNPVRASFLRYNARGLILSGAIPRKFDGRMMGLLSATWCDEQFENALKWHKAQGDNTLFLAFADQGDNGAPIEIYAGPGIYVGGDEFDWNDISRIKHRLTRMAEEGFAVVAWLTMDDSPAIANAGIAALVQHAEDVFDLFDYALAGYCTGLESDEDERRDAIPYIAATLQGLTDKPVFAHYTRGDWQRAKREGHDGLMDQVGFDKAYEYCRDRARSMTSTMMLNWSEGIYIFAEYDKDSNKGYGPRILKDVPAVRGYGNG